MYKIVIACGENMCAYVIQTRPPTKNIISMEKHQTEAISRTKYILKEGKKRKENPQIREAKLGTFSKFRKTELDTVC